MCFREFSIKIAYTHFNICICVTHTRNNINIVFFGDTGKGRKGKRKGYCPLFGSREFFLYYEFIRCKREIFYIVVIIGKLCVEIVHLRDLTIKARIRSSNSIRKGLLLAKMNQVDTKNHEKSFILIDKFYE